MFPTALGKYKSQELGALSTVFVKQEPLLRKNRVGGVRWGVERRWREGEQSRVLGALAVWEGPKDGGEGRSLLGPCRSGPPCSISVLPLLGPHREPSSPTLLPVTLESFHANVT